MANYLKSDDLENIAIALKDLNKDVVFHLKKAFQRWTNPIVSEPGILTTIMAHLPPYESVKVSEKVLSAFRSFAA